MPNWCYNTLEVRGQIEDVRKFFEHAKSVTQQLEMVEFNPSKYDMVEVKRDLDFNKFIPMPDELKNTESAFGGSEEEQKNREERYQRNMEKYGYKNWYDWSVANWDTKWNAGDVEFSINEEIGSLYYNFSTAWSPPMSVFNKMAEMFPTLKFHATYRDEGDAFYGESGWKDGKQLFEREISPADSSWMDEEEDKS